MRSPPRAVRRSIAPMPPSAGCFSESAGTSMAARSRFGRGSRRRSVEGGCASPTEDRRPVNASLSQPAHLMVGSPSPRPVLVRCFNRTNDLPSTPMCGITGWVDWSRDLRSEKDVLLKMARTMALRGPDAEGTFVTERAALAHRRLIVLDPEGGKQPMSCRYGDRTYAITYNGEIYNFVELRQ